MRRLLGWSLALAGFAGLSSPAHAQWSQSSVFTEDGVELGVEPRIFALFAVLNAAGYDKETAFGPAPLEKPRYAAAREKIRQNLGRSGNTEFTPIFEKYPGSVQDYVNAVLELGPAPRFDDKGATSPLAKALAAPLREWFNEEGGSSMLRGAQEEARATQKRVLPTLDAAVKGATKLVRLGDASDQLLEDTAGTAGRVAVVINELDAAGTMFIVQAKDTTGIITGPSRGKADDDATVDAAVLAYARTLVAGEAVKVAPAGTLLEGFAKLSDATKKTIADEKAYAVALLSCSVAREVQKRAVACGAVDVDVEGQAALALMAPRMAAYAPTTALFSAALPEILSSPPPPPPPEPTPPPPPEPKKKGKK